MPPNPRDHLTPNEDVPLDRVHEVVANALRESFLGPAERSRLAERVVERLGHFRLLAYDVEGQRCFGDYHTTPHRNCILR